MRFAVSVHGLKSRFDSAALLLPLAPERIPSFSGQLPFGMLTSAAQFFVGQQALLAGNRAAAEQAFRAALATKAARFDEYRGARAELVRMGVKP